MTSPDTPIHIEVEPVALVRLIADSPAAVQLLRDLVGDPAGQPSASGYCTVGEASELLRSQRQRVYDLLSVGKLTRYKDGGRTLLSRVEIENYIAEGAFRGDTPVTPALEPHPGSRVRR